MAVCERCEGTNFELHDGFYFCTNCALQSQELVQFEEETTTAAATAEDATTRGNETLTQKGRQKKLTTKGLRSKLRRMCELAKDIPPISSLLITKTVLEKLADIFLIDLTKLQREKFDRILWSMWSGYEKYLHTWEGEPFSMRDYFFFKQSSYFYLLYLYGLWDTRGAIFREAVKTKIRKRKDAKKAEQESSTNIDNKVIDAEDAEQEAAVATEIEQMLSDLKRRVGRDPNPAEQEDESVTGNVTLCTKLTYQQDVVVEDFEVDPEVSLETKKIVSSYFMEDEQAALNEACNWYRNIFGAGSRKKCKRDPDNILRPMPRVAYAILYMVSALINKPIFLNDMVQKIVYNEAPLLDLVSWLPDVVLTKNEFNFWVNAGMNSFPAIIRNIAKRLFRVLFNSGLLPSECIEPGQNEYLRGKCQWALRFLNLPLSLSHLCLSLLDSCRLKLISTRNKQRFAILPDSILHFDVFIFVSIFIVKHAVIDSCDDKRMKKLSRLWLRWAHRTLFGKTLPPHMLMFGDKLQLQHDDSVLSYLKISRHLNTLKFRNRFHNYRRFEFPNWAQKQLILWEMLSDNLNVEAHIEDYSIFVDKKVERILKTDDVSHNAREFELRPSLSEVKLSFDEDFLQLSITSQCRQLAISKKLVTASLGNEKIMYYDVTNLKLQNHRFADEAAGALLDDRELPVGIESVMELRSEETLDFDSHKETLVEIAQDFERKTGSKMSNFKSANDEKIAECGVFVETKEGLESFGIYDELFCLGALVGGDDFRLAVREFITIVGKSS